MNTLEKSFHPNCPGSNLIVFRQKEHNCIHELCVIVLISDIHTNQAQFITIVALNRTTQRQSGY